jgi:hypothetical protein
MPIPNKIKYSTTPTDGTIKVGNFILGVTDGASYGPTSETGFYQGLSPVISGYTVYQNKATLGPATFRPNNDSEFINLTRALGGNVTGVTDSLVYLNGKSDITVVNRDYENIITNGLVLNLDAGFTPSYPRSGTTWVDLSYSSNTVTLINGTTFSSDKGGNIVFDGVNDYVNVLNNINPSNITLEFFYRTFTSASYEYLVSNARDCCGVYKGYELRVVNGVPRFTIWNSTDSTVVGSLITFGQIQHVSATYNGTQTKIYQNGALVNTTNTTLGIGNPPSYNLAIGGMGLRPDTYNLNGNIYLARIYNRELSSSEILQNYQKQFTRYLGENIVTDNLVLYLDAGYGTSYPTSGTTWYDVSGYGRNGTLTNGPTYSGGSSGSIVFDGVDDYITLSSQLSVLSGTPEASLCMWIKLVSGSNASGLSGLIQLSSYNNTNGNLYFFTDSLRVGGIWLDIFRTDRLFTGDWAPTFNPTNWHLLTVTTTPGTNGWKMYLNGILRYQTTGQSVVSVDSSLFGGFRLGQNNGSREINGNISICQIYNKALSQDEITQNFNAQKSRFGL